jgi:signal transduction histidine kinase/DNA-binding response OmpR family regulator
MQSAPLTPGEARRLDILDSLGVVDTPADPVLDGIVRAAAELTGCPVSLVSLVDDQRQWFKARHGLDVQQTPRELAFCAHAILQTELFEVNDARLDARFVGNPLVTGDPHMVFYAGVPLSVEGHSMGTLCVIDHAPRQLSAAQRHTLTDLARAAEHWLQTQLSATEKRRMTEELERHQLHLEHLVEQRTAALVEARRAAEAASEAKSAFLATMSHEIRTPMNGVVGSLDLLQHSKLSAYQRDLIDTISESALGLLTIIDDILDFSKIEAGQLKLQSEAVSLERLTDSVCNALRPTATSHGVDLQVDVAPGLPDWILSDGTRLRQILNNLLGNAIKFSAGMGRAGRVQLRLQPCGPDFPGHLQLSVTDNGIGMTPEVMQRIFQPFVQAESATTRRLGGTGLGLSICKRLAGLMGGWVKVDSESGQGSIFTVILPFQSTSAPHPVVDDNPALVMRTGPHFVPSGGPVVLVAEDNSVNQKVIGHQLALLGLAVEMVSDGLEALALWRAGRANQRHALLLTDLHMPGIDGYTLASTIRSEEAGGSRLPIVALSANALNGEMERCRLAGMDDYLSKPVRTAQLGEVVRRWLPPDDAPTLTPLGTVECEDVHVIEVELGPCVYDDQALVRLVGDEPELLAEFRQRFVVAALNTVDEMRRAASGGNTLTLSNLAHRLSSSCRMIGAVALGECCSRIERAGSGCSPSEMHRLMAQLEDALAQVMTRLSGHGGLQHSNAAG